MRYFDSGHDGKNGSERETGLEPATLCLGSRCSTTELLPRACWDGYWCPGALVSILPNDYSGSAWEASTLPLSYTRNLLSILSNGMSTDVKDKLFRWYKRQQFPGNSGIFGYEE